MDRKSKDETGQWVVDWFSRQYPVDESQLDLNYFDAGLIDSFAIIELIGDIEAEFPVRFNDEHFQDPRFTTIRGLSEMIHELSEEEAGLNG